MLILSLVFFTTYYKRFDNKTIGVFRLAVQGYMSTYAIGYGCRHIPANERVRRPLICSLVFTRSVDVNARLAGHRRRGQVGPHAHLYRTTYQHPSTADTRTAQTQLSGPIPGPAGSRRPGPRNE